MFLWGRQQRARIANQHVLSVGEAQRWGDLDSQAFWVTLGDSVSLFPICKPKVIALPAPGIRRM